MHTLRGINFCLDLSATPYFLGRVGQDTNQTFPWVVSDFGLIDAIESGLVKIPQLVVRDTTGAEVPGYFNIWRYIMEQADDRGERRRHGNPRPEAILKHANHPIAMLGGDLGRVSHSVGGGASDDPRPPVFILVCKTTKIAKVIYEWIGENKPPVGIPSCNLTALRNTEGRPTRSASIPRWSTRRIRREAKSDEFALDATHARHGRQARLARGRAGPAVYPDGFEELAQEARAAAASRRGATCAAS